MPIHTTEKRASAVAPCIWMQAGVVLKKMCRLDYDCSACRFDRALLRLAGENKRAASTGSDADSRRSKIDFWKDRLKTLPQWKQPCIHHMKKHIEFRACTNAYRCDTCEFDQYFYDEYTVHAIVKPLGFLDIEGFKLPQGYYLHKGHAWIKIEEGGEARIGLDDFVRRLLGPLDAIESPLVGKKLTRDHADITLKRGALVAGILSPLNGVVTAVNPGLRQPGDLSAQDPYSHGWIARIHSHSLRNDLKHLMIGDETINFLRAEIACLYDVIEQARSPLAADGGLLGNDILGHIPEIGWKRLTKIFLRA